MPDSSPTGPVSSPAPSDHRARGLTDVARFLAVGVPSAFLAFLLLSGFFSAWEGRVVSVRPAGGPAEAPTSVEVRIAAPDGSEDARIWPADILTGAKEPILTKKDRFSFGFTVSADGGPEIRVPTATRATIALPLVALLFALLLRNALVSGSPFRVDSRDMLPPTVPLTHLPPAPETLPPVPPLPVGGTLVDPIREGDKRLEPEKAKEPEKKKKPGYTWPAPRGKRR